MILGVFILTGLVVFVALLAPLALDPTVMIFYGSLLVTLIMMYIGGNVWATWIKSKYFRKELADKETLQEAGKNIAEDVSKALSNLGDEIGEDNRPPGGI